MIAAASVERPQVRKVRASQTSGGGDSKESATEIYRRFWLDQNLVRVEGQCKRLPPFW